MFQMKYMIENLGVCKWVPVIVVCMMVCGCTSRMMINPEYKSKAISGKQLHIALVGPTRIDYEGNMENEFSEQGRYGKIRTFICSTAVKTVKESSTFKSVDMNPLDCKSFYSKELRWSGDSVKFIMKLPDDGCYSETDSQSIFLFIEQITVTSHPTVQLIMINFIPIGAIPHKPLTIAGRYVYWDVAAKKPIAWGMASGTFDRGAGVTMENWRNAACDFSLNLIKKSPFDPAYNQTKTSQK
jgi:hypothetical protein